MSRQAVSVEIGLAMSADDNAAMIAYAGLERFRSGKSDDMTLAARPRWPLDKTAPALLGSGKKGAKA